MVSMWGLPARSTLSHREGNRYFFAWGGHLFRRRTPKFWRFHRAAPTAPHPVRRRRRPAHPVRPTSHGRPPPPRALPCLEARALVSVFEDTQPEPNRTDQRTNRARLRPAPLPPFLNSSPHCPRALYCAPVLVRAAV